MSTVVSCPSCSGKLRLPDDLRGQQVRCPACNNVFDPTAPPPVAAPPAQRDPSRSGSPSPAVDAPLRLSLDDADDPPAPPPAVPQGSGFGFVELDRRLDSPQEPAAPPSQAADVPASPPEPRRPSRRSEEDDLRECPSCGRHIHRDSGRCYHCGRRFGGRPRIVYDDPERHDWEPDRGGVVLVLGVLSLVCLVICGPAGMALGITAWALGHGDLRKMNQRRMDPSGYGTTQGGYVCGILGTFLNALWTLGCAAILVFAWYDSHRPIPTTKPVRPPIQWKDRGW